jgi:hypothetical protein
MDFFAGIAVAKIRSRTKIAVWQMSPVVSLSRMQRRSWRGALEGIVLQNSL